MTNLPASQKNQLIVALPDVEYQRLYSSLELIYLPLGEVLYEYGGTLNYVYFPTNCIISLLCDLENGHSSEIAIVGNEGMIGIAHFLGGGSMPNRAVVQSTGYAYRMRGAIMMKEFNLNGVLTHLLLRYTQTLITQMTQNVVCNRYHSVVQQLCRWLLRSIDRLSSDELTMTHELIANMLGVRRETVTEAFGKLHQAGLIDHRRSHIRVLDRSGLEKRACECYRVVKTAYDRLMPHEVLRKTAPVLNQRTFPSNVQFALSMQLENSKNEIRRLGMAHKRQDDNRESARKPGNQLAGSAQLTH